MNIVTGLVCIAILSLAGCVAETGTDEPTPTQAAPVAADNELYPENCSPAVLDDAEEPAPAR